jgi:hypothetical protein
VAARSIGKEEPQSGRWWLELARSITGSMMTSIHMLEKDQWSLAMDWKTAWKPADFHENQRNWSWFLVNRLSKFEIFKKMNKFEIKNSKKTRVHFNILCENKIQKLEINRSAKLGEEKTEGQTEKIENQLVPYKAPTLGH